MGQSLARTDPGSGETTARSIPELELEVEPEPEPQEAEPILVATSRPASRKKRGKEALTAYRISVSIIWHEMKRANVAGRQRRVRILLAQAVVIPGKYGLLGCRFRRRKLSSSVHGHRWSRRWINGDSRSVVRLKAVIRGIPQPRTQK